MSIHVYRDVPPFILNYLLPFSKAGASADWEDVYDAMRTLRERFPDKKFADEPFHYVDLERGKAGLVFAEFNTDDAYLVLQESRAETQ